MLRSRPIETPAVSTRQLSSGFRAGAERSASPRRVPRDTRTRRRTKTSRLAVRAATWPTIEETHRPMLARQTVVYFAANVFSAVFGLLEHDDLHARFRRRGLWRLSARLRLRHACSSTFLASALKLAILREQAGRGADIRGVDRSPPWLLFAPAAPVCLSSPARLFGLSRVGRGDRDAAGARRHAL